MTKLDHATTTELEAAAFRRLVEHLRERNDVQNIDMMNLAGFCRNCLSNWYQEAAAERHGRDRGGNGGTGDSQCHVPAHRQAAAPRADDAGAGEEGARLSSAQSQTRRVPKRARRVFLWN